MAVSSSSAGVTDRWQAQAMQKKVAASVGREVCVFVRPAAITPEEQTLKSQVQEEESEEFYEFTPEDYARLMASKKEDVYLKTRKIREQEAAARRSKVSKAIIRVQFPDNYVLEARFQSCNPVSLIFDMVRKVISHPELPFYIYTSPPKQCVRNLEQSMYDAGFAPGALLYFSYDLPKEPIIDGAQAHDQLPYLREDVAALKDVHLLLAQSSSDTVALSTEGDTGTDAGPQAMPDSGSVRPAAKRVDGKPKWLRLSSK